MTIRTESSDHKILGSVPALVGSVLLPRICPICLACLDHAEPGWCNACERGMRVLSSPLCPNCKRYLKPGESACESVHDSSTLSVLYAIATFDGAFGTLAHALKYDGYRNLAAPLGRLMAERIGSATFDLIVPVPTAPHKRSARGFGHAEEIARHCAEALNIRLLSKGLAFSRRVSDQTHLSAAQRQLNMHNALHVPDPEAVRGKSVLVIDDVFTTGATVLEAARALRDAGSGAISASVISVNLGQ